MRVGVDVPFFDYLGLTNVVWLDDLFDPKPTPDEIDIAEQVAISHQAGTLILTYPQLDDLTADDSPQEWARRILERLNASQITDFLSQIAPPGPAVVPGQPLDYSLSELEQVATSLSTTIQRVGLERWPEVKEQLIASGQDGVFLVDRERRTRGERTNVGDGIVKELVERCAGDSFVVVLTHSIGPDGTETLRSLLASELDIRPEKLGVVSKRPGTGSLADGVRSAVRITLTQHTCASMCARIASVMEQSLKETSSALRRLPVQALDKVVFDNSFGEGASEIDVLFRILSSRQRVAIQDHIVDSFDNVHSPLARMRKLRLIVPLPDLPTGDASLLVQWRKDEVFDVGPRLNSLRTPLASGDVFKKNDTEKYFVLLAQPCDLAVRSNGSRSANEGILVKVKVGYDPKIGAEGRFFEVPPLNGGQRWALDFREWVAVSLECLEWVSFNADGRMTFSNGAQMPGGLLPGWQIRFTNAQNRFAEGRKYCLSLGKIPGAAATASATDVGFPYIRVARLHEPRSAAAYGAFASYHARSAFDHDFTKGLDEPQHNEG